MQYSFISEDVLIDSFSVKLLEGGNRRHEDVARDRVKGVRTMRPSRLRDDPPLNALRLVQVAGCLMFETATAKG